MPRKTKYDPVEPWVIPDQVLRPKLRDYLEVMSKAVFQAGLSWAAIARNWDAYLAAFDRFEPKDVAMYDRLDVERLMATENLLHSKKKIEGTIANARTILELDQQHSGFKKYLRSFDDYDALVKDFRKRFKFMGPMNVWYFLFRVNEPVPKFELWIETIEGDHPRMKDMVERARARGTSTEY